MSDFPVKITKKQLKEIDRRQKEEKRLQAERVDFDNMERYKNDILPYIPKKKK